MFTTTKECDEIIQIYSSQHLLMADYIILQGTKTHAGLSERIS